MLQEPWYTLRVIWACAKKDVKSALTERVFTIISVFVPVNVLILLSLFVLAGSHAPTAVVMNDTGPYAQQFYNAMNNAHSFQLQKSSASEANNLIAAGRIVAVVTIPSDFDTRVAHNQPVQVSVKINNLNTDFTNDIRRAVPLSITAFYARAFPDVVTITPKEQDLQPQDTDYIPYLTVSIIVIGDGEIWDEISILRLQVLFLRCNRDHIRKCSSIKSGNGERHCSPDIVGEIGIEVVDFYAYLHGLIVSNSSVKIRWYRDNCHYAAGGNQIIGLTRAGLL